METVTHERPEQVLAAARARLLSSLEACKGKTIAAIAEDSGRIALSFDDGSAVVIFAAVSERFEDMPTLRVAKLGVHGDSGQTFYRLGLIDEATFAAWRKATDAHNAAEAMARQQREHERLRVEAEDFNAGRTGAAAFFKPLVASLRRMLALPEEESLAIGEDGVLEFEVKEGGIARIRHLTGERVMLPPEGEKWARDIVWRRNGHPLVPGNILVVKAKDLIEC